MISYELADHTETIINVASIQKALLCKIGWEHRMRTHQKVMQMQDVQLRMTLCFDILIALNTIHHLARLATHNSLAKTSNNKKINKAFLKLY